MGLVLKHVITTKAGTFLYRRRVPKAVSSIITKREFKQKLGDTRNEALAVYPRVHAQVEREIGEALRRLALADAAAMPGATEREAYEEAMRRRAEHVRWGMSPEDMELTGEAMLDGFLSGKAGIGAENWQPVGVSPVDRHTVNLLRIGPDRYRPPAPTLKDALRVYLKDHLDADNPATDRRTVQRVERVIGAALEVFGKLQGQRPGAAGSDPPLVSITRETARAVWDHMLNRVKTTGERVSRATAERELTTLAAVVAFGAREFDLPETFRNPFHSLRSSGRGQRDEGTAADKRQPLPPEVLAAVRASVLHGAGPQLALIWRLLEGTGCRIAEVTGLRVEDVGAAAEFPHIRIAPHALRGLKTGASHRLVPLVGDALEAAKEAFALPREGHMLFPQYGRERGGDAASAALMKHIRKVTEDPRHVVHSLRHNMKDRLILAEVATLEQNLILGHAASGLGDKVYGGSVAKLRATTRAMQRALVTGE